VLFDRSRKRSRVYHSRQVFQSQLSPIPSSQPLQSDDSDAPSSVEQARSSATRLSLGDLCDGASSYSADNDIDDSEVYGNMDGDESALHSKCKPGIDHGDVEETPERPILQDFNRTSLSPDIDSNSYDDGEDCYFHHPNADPSLIPRSSSPVVLEPGGDAKYSSPALTAIDTPDEDFPGLTVTIREETDAEGADTAEDSSGLSVSAEMNADVRIEKAPKISDILKVPISTSSQNQQVSGLSQLVDVEGDIEGMEPQPLILTENCKLSMLASAVSVLHVEGNSSDTEEERTESTKTTERKGPNLASNKTATACIPVVSSGRATDMTQNDQQDRNSQLSIDTYGAERAVVHSQIPSDVVDGALSTLKPGQWLSSTAIELTLRLFQSTEFRILDSAYVSVSDPGSISNKPPLKWNYERYVLAPLHFMNHWSLLKVDLPNGTLDYYDSMPSKETQHHVQKAAMKFANFLNSSSHSRQLPWRFRYSVSSVKIIYSTTKN
jgi:hypothetical protein